MILSLLACATVSFHLPVSKTPPVIDSNRMIAVILELEGTPWDQAGGALGIQPDTWAEQTHLPYTLAMHRPSACIWAKERMARLAVRLIALDIEPTPYLLASIWRHGWDGAMNRRWHTDDYGDRAQNLYDDPSFNP